jgi:XTP/dITP diphosphohydrolase
VREFATELARLGVEVDHTNLGYREVQADTLEEVVRHGMEELRRREMEDFIIDDSGLFVRALGGFPGVYSAYALRTLGCGGLLKLMNGEEERRASFRCCIGCWSRELGEIVVEAEAPGVIGLSEKGEEGFGFDPIFLPEGRKLTYAQLPLDEKNVISHRGKAIRALVTEMKKRMEVNDGAR